MAIAEVKGDGADAVRKLLPSIMEPEPAIPKACKKERLLQVLCSNRDHHGLCLYGVNYGEYRT